jgi:hypothetical protein
LKVEQASIETIRLINSLLFIDELAATSPSGNKVHSKLNFRLRLLPFRLNLSGYGLFEKKRGE